MEYPGQAGEMHDHIWCMAYSCILQQNQHVSDLHISSGLQDAFLRQYAIICASYLIGHACMEVG